jgi:hypothetical protein
MQLTSHKLQGHRDQDSRTTTDACNEGDITEAERAENAQYYGGACPNCAEDPCSCGQTYVRVRENTSEDERTKLEVEASTKQGGDSVATEAGGLKPAPTPSAEMEPGEAAVEEVAEMAAEPGEEVEENGSEAAKLKRAREVTGLRNLIPAIDREGDVDDRQNFMEAAATLLHGMATPLMTPVAVTRLLSNLDHRSICDVLESPGRHSSILEMALQTETIWPAPSDDKAMWCCAHTADNSLIWWRVNEKTPLRGRVFYDKPPGEHPDFNFLQDTFEELREEEQKQEEAVSIQFLDGSESNGQMLGNGATGSVRNMVWTASSLSCSSMWCTCVR